MIYIGGYLLCAMLFYLAWWKRMPRLNSTILGQRVDGWVPSKADDSSPIYTEHSGYYNLNQRATSIGLHRSGSYSPVDSMLISLVGWWFVSTVIVVTWTAVVTFDVVTFIPFRILNQPTWPIVRDRMLRLKIRRMAYRRAQETIDAHETYLLLNA